MITYIPITPNTHFRALRPLIDMQAWLGTSRVWGGRAFEPRLRVAQPDAASTAERTRPPSSDQLDLSNFLDGRVTPPGSKPPVPADSSTVDKITAIVEDLFNFDIPLLGREPKDTKPDTPRHSVLRKPSVEPPSVDVPAADPRTPAAIQTVTDVIGKGVHFLKNLFGDPLDEEGATESEAQPVMANVEVQSAPGEIIETTPAAMLSASRPGSLGFLIPMAELSNVEYAALQAIMSRLFVTAGRAAEASAHVGDAVTALTQIKKVRDAISVAFPQTGVYKGQKVNAGEVIWSEVIVPLAVDLGRMYQLPTGLLAAALYTIAYFESGHELPPRTNPGSTAASGIFQYVKSVRAGLEEQLGIKFEPGNLAHELAMARAYFSDLLSFIMRNFDISGQDIALKFRPSKVSWDPRTPEQLQARMTNLLNSLALPRSAVGRIIGLMIVGHRAGFNPAIGWSDARRHVNDEAVLINEIADKRIPSTLWVFTNIIESSNKGSGK